MKRGAKSAEPRIERAGAWLYEAHRAGDKFAPLPAELSPHSVADAYAVQSEYVGMRAATLGPVTGYKIALTSHAMRAMAGLDDSIAGDLLEKTILQGGASLRAAGYVRLLVEFEIAVEMAEDLPAIGAPYDRQRVAQAVAAVMPAIEYADDRDADYSMLRQNVLTLIADNVWNEGTVLGGAVRDWKKVDLASLRVVASINGKEVGEGYGRDVMGHPLDALAWLANNLASRGLGLWRGDKVITGSVVTSKFPQAGDLVRFDAGVLGAVELRVD